MPAKKTRREDLPGTLKRSPKKAQDTYADTLDSAHETYQGDEGRAHRTAFAAVKHSFEKVGDHWEPKDHKGPSDPDAAKSKPGSAARRDGKTYGGVDVVGHTKGELYERARSLEVRGRSSMSKTQLAEAIARKQD
ncbi:MAG: ChaB family protein [Mycobacteriales bacterium]